MNIEIAYQRSKGFFIFSIVTIFLPALGLMVWAVNMATSVYAQHDGDVILFLSFISVTLFLIGIWQIYQYSSHSKDGKIILLDEKQISIPHKNDEEVDVIQLLDIKEVSHGGYHFHISTLDDTYSIDPGWCTDGKKLEELYKFFKHLEK